MPSSATTSNRLEKQQPGENTNTWGTKLNQGGLDRLDEALDGRSAFTLSGSKTLTSSNYVADEARMRFLDITSGTGGTVTIPGVSKTYLVRNATSGSVIFTTASSTLTATVPSGGVAWVGCDGTEVYLALILDLGASLIKTTGTPTLATHLTTKTYVDGLNTAQTAYTDAAEVDAKAYTDATAFNVAAGVLPGQTGSAGKFLTTNGAAASWGSQYPSQTGNAGKSLITDGTAAAWTSPFPTQTGNSGKVLSSNGTAESWQLAVPLYQRKTTTYTAVAGDRLVCDTTGGAFTVTLPATPANGDLIEIGDGGNIATPSGWSKTNLTIARNGSTINGVAEDLVCNIKGASVTMVYNNSTWRVKLG